MAIYTVLEGNAFYEIDEECMRRQKRGDGKTELLKEGDMVCPKDSYHDGCKDADTDRSADTDMDRSADTDR